MRQNELTLYGRGAAGINTWKIWSVGNIIHIEANGCRYAETVKEGKSGRSLSEQLLLRITARARVKLDMGFKRSVEQLGDRITNQLGLAAPMLAQPLKRAVSFSRDHCYVQPKLDGHRCLINEDGAYSRRGKVIDTIPEILNSILVPPGTILDGELYCHGVPLQTIASWARRRQPDTLKLKYHIYDIIIEGKTYKERNRMINQLDYGEEFIEIVPTILFDSDKSPHDYCRHYRECGYEGAILRPGRGMYDIGKRSKNLLKVKVREDAEYECVDIVSSAYGWGILILKTPEGKTFRTSAPGNREEKREALHNKGNYIGRSVTCEYAELTKEKIPFHCVAIRWREDL